MTASNDRTSVKVAEISVITPLVKRFRFEPVNSGALTTFSGGAHIIVDMPDGDSIRRNAYSLMGDPSDAGSYMISVRLEEAGRGGSSFLHRKIKEGSTLKISRPINLFPLVQTARKHIFIAGGIGITPFMAMMEQLRSRTEDFETHYVARTPDAAAYADDLVERFGGRIALYFSEQGPRIDIQRILSHQPVGSHLYVCGPERLIQHVVAIAAAAGWPGQTVHQERFGSPKIGAPYTVTLARSAVVVNVRPDQSMLEAIEGAGVDAPYLCRGGACGECETRVLACDGSLIHADHYLSNEDKAARTKVMPCVSRFQGRQLVLDL